MLKYFKTPGQQWSGVFVCGLLIYWLSVSLAYGLEPMVQCPATGSLQMVTVSRVLDGDTLYLADGRKLRLIAVNTPELSRKNRSSQPLAREAKQLAVDFLSTEKVIYIQKGASEYDRYGRLLAHVYRADGRGLAEQLLSLGLAWQVVVPPNSVSAKCLTEVEELARQLRLGVWNPGIYPLLKAGKLTVKDAGFQRVQGKLLSAKRAGKTWWLQLDKLALRLSDKDLARFGDFDPVAMIGQRLIVRGWIIDRSASGAVKKYGYSPLMMKLEHPLMLN